MPMWEHKHTTRLCFAQRAILDYGPSPIKAFDREFSKGTRYDNPNWRSRRAYEESKSPVQWSSVWVALVYYVWGTFARGAFGIPAIETVRGWLASLGYGKRIVGPRRVKLQIRFNSGEGC